MEMKPFRAFGMVFVLNTHMAGESYEHTLENPTATIFCSEGRQTVTRIDTGGRVDDLVAGHFLTPDTYTRGAFRCDVVEDTTIYCYDPKLNEGKAQNFTPVVVGSGEQIVFPKGSKFFLCRGGLSVGGRVIQSPSPIEVQSEGKIATAISPVWGLFVG